jgi:hypothetical protein
LASVVQWASVAVAGAALLAALRWASPVASLQVTILASQLLSAPLRDHYAVLLLLPVAWLMARGHKWAALIPFLGWISLFATDDAASWPAVASIPLTFFGVLAIVLWEAWRERGETGREAVSQAASAAAEG